MTANPKALQNVRVDLGDRGYDIVIGSGVLARAGAYIRPCLKGRRVAIITDENVAKLHLETLVSALSGEASGQALQIDTIILPPGESQKSFPVLQDVLAQLLAKNYGRNDTLIAFGGGVIGDLTGFAASILKRGCGFIQIPTTLLAQVDSSVGGKTAINTGAGKNLVGAFYQPSLVLADTDVLATLPARQLKAGYAEIVKYGLLGDLKFFEWLEDHGGEVLQQDQLALSQAVARSCKAKAEIVRQDEREHGKRALLNLGHTFGHALEGKAGYSDVLLHGEGVSAGMIMAFEFSRLSGLCTGQEVSRVRAHFAALDMPLPETLPKGLLVDPDALFRFMMHDKKNQDEDLTLILVRGIGEAYTHKKADKAAVRSFLTELCKG